jgi:membrane associated rhomboid family serine protease
MEEEFSHETDIFFPLVTFILAVINIGVYIFTYKNIGLYQYLFGFIPTAPKFYTIITYMFIHANLSHILGNMLMLFVVGLTVEQVLGKLHFFIVYIISGIIAVFFDIVGRLIFHISFSLPFIGASGAVFGLVGLLVMLKPFEKIPTFITLLFALPLIMMLGRFDVLLTNPMFLIVTISSFCLLIVFSFMFVPFIPAMISFALYTLFVIIMIFTGLGGNVSYLGHFGGILGGILSFTLFAKKSTTK